MRLNINKSILALGLMVLSSITLAADRVLLVGVGQYANPAYNLPGIDLDINVMQGVVQQLGFKNTDVKVLMNEQATLVNVDNAIANWLTEGVNEDDHVLFYFSGHGTRIPDVNDDESDGQDEVLTMYDVGTNGRSLKGVLRDDRINQLLSKIPTSNVLVVVDACNSGTVTRNIQFTTANLSSSEAVTKFLHWEGMPEASASKLLRNGTDKDKYGNNYVAITAARDDEQAVASINGSYFTLGVSNVIRNSVSTGALISPKVIRDEVERFILANVNAPSKPYHPQLSGSAALINKPIRIQNTTSSNNDNIDQYSSRIRVSWNAMDEIVRRSEPLAISSNKRSFALGQSLEINVDVPQSGYLNVINIGPDDRATILYPNKFNPNNNVFGGALTIPTAQMNFLLKAREPLGESLTVAVLTEKPINLYRLSLANRNAKGEILSVFGELSPLGLKSLRGNFEVVGKSRRAIYAGKVLTRVCQLENNCR